MTACESTAAATERGLNNLIHCKVDSKAVTVRVYTANSLPCNSDGLRVYTAAATERGLNNLIHCKVDSKAVTVRVYTANSSPCNSDGLRVYCSSY